MQRFFLLLVLISCILITNTALADTTEEKDANKKKELIEKAKKSDLYHSMLNCFSDAELVEVQPVKSDD